MCNLFPTATQQQSLDTCKALQDMIDNRNIFAVSRCRLNKICTSVGCVRREPQIEVHIKFIFHPCGNPIGVTVLLTLQPAMYITETTNITNRLGILNVEVEQTDKAGINFGVSH